MVDPKLYGLYLGNYEVTSVVIGIVREGDDLPTHGMTMDDAVTRMRGKRATTRPSIFKGRVNALPSAVSGGSGRGGGGRAPGTVLVTMKISGTA